MRLWMRFFPRLLLGLYRQRIAVLLLLLVVAGLGTYEIYSARTQVSPQDAAAGTLPIEVTVQSLQARGSSATLTLKEKNGSRGITMSVDGIEALVIASAEGSPVPANQQPKAYDLMSNVISQMGGQVEKVIVNDATQNDYYCEVVLNEGSDLRVVKAQPADAIALALTAKAPIYVEDKVLDQFGTRGASGI